MVHQEGNIVYAEVEALSVLMGYKTSNAGCCKVRLLVVTIMVQAALRLSMLN
jgi:hypothetical protein